MVVSGVPTTAPFHILILENEFFKKGDVDTGFIVKHADDLKARSCLAVCVSTACLCAAVCGADW
jgi:acetyl/propionyl-CoA carboxylase alpha subunit